MTKDLGDLNSDDLGAAAEAAFELLCSQAKLACNRSQRDRTGWDFIVEFSSAPPNAPTTDTNLRAPPAPVDPRLRQRAPSLDQRDKALTCHVQVKATIGARSDRVSMRLSSAEHLAKDPKPAFVVVPIMTADGGVQGGYLIHLLHDPLAKVLKRLRQAEADGKTDINHATLSFDFRKQGIRFAWSREGLRAALTNAVAGDLSDYVVLKQSQLKKLGYDAGRYEMDTTFSVARDDLADVLLGLKPILPQSLSTFDKRFGIRLPIEQFDASHSIELRLTPKAFDRCQVVIKGPPLTVPSKFDGEAIGPVALARLAEDQIKMLINAEPFRITLTARNLKFDVTLEADARRTPAEWKRLLRALSHLATGEGVISLHPASAPIEPIHIPITTPITGELVDEIPELLRIIDIGERLLGLVDAHSEPMTLDEIAVTVIEIGNAASVLLEAPPTVLLDMTGALPEGTSTRAPALFVDHIVWGGKTLAYTTKGFFHRSVGKTDWAFDPLVEVVDISLVPSGGLRSYAEAQVAGQHGHVAVFRAEADGPNPPAVD